MPFSSSAKALLKYVAPTTHDCLVNFYRESLRLGVMKLPQCAYHYNLQRKNAGAFAVHIDASFGFFAFMRTYLYIIFHCELHGLVPYVSFGGNIYNSNKHNENWLYNYFYPKTPHLEELVVRLADQRLKVSTISGPSDLWLDRRYKDRLTIGGAKELLDKHLGLRDEISFEVESFWAVEFSGRNVVGIHYRGTDKHKEAARVPWDVVITETRKVLERDGSFQAIFVASDEPEFIEYLHTKITDLPIKSYENKETYYGGVPAHSVPGDKYIKGKEALVNSLLLSRCQHCVKTASQLSAWAKIFNPELRITMLNRPLPYACWFPENVILEAPFDRGHV